MDTQLIQLPATRPDAAIVPVERQLNASLTARCFQISRGESAISIFTQMPSVGCGPMWNSIFSGQSAARRFAAAMYCAGLSPTVSINAAARSNPLMRSGAGSLPIM